MSDFEDNRACVGIRPVSRWKNFKVPRTGEWVRMPRAWPEEKWEDFVVDLTEDSSSSSSSSDSSSSDSDSDSQHESNSDAAESDQTDDPNDGQTTNLATLPLTLSSTTLTPPPATPPPPYDPLTPVYTYLHTTLLTPATLPLYLPDIHTTTIHDWSRVGAAKIATNIALFYVRGVTSQKEFEAMMEWVLVNPKLLRYATGMVKGWSDWVFERVWQKVGEGGTRDD